VAYATLARAEPLFGDMLFTSTTAPFRATPSALFREKGDLDGYPGKACQSRIFGVSPACASGWPVYRSVIPQVATANVLSAPFEGSSALWMKPIKFHLSVPDTGISFNNPTEELVNKALSMGFVSDTLSRLMN
jgi:hypothetical protein